MRALVTGGSGFIGQRVIKRLLDRGIEVVSLSLPGPVPDEPWVGDVEWLTGDMLDPSIAANATRKCDLLVHLAAPVGVAGEYDWQWQVMVEGTRQLWSRVASQGGRAVVISSIAVYGTKIQSQTCSEATGFGPWAGAYGRAKQGKEEVARQIAARYAAPLTLVRPANVYGLGGGGAWGDRLVAAIKSTGGATFGDAERNNAGLVHVDNLADAILLAATREGAVGKVFNVCDGEPVTWHQFMADLAALVGRPPPPNYPLHDALRLAMANEDPATLQAPADPALPSLEGLNLVGFDNRIDASLINRTLGWVPAVKYANAMAEARATWRNE